MIPFVVYLFVVFGAITVMTWWLMAVIVRDDFRSWVEPLTDAQFANLFVRAVIIATITPVVWVIAISWPPSLDRLRIMFTSIGAILLLQPISVCGFALWLFIKEYRRRKEAA